MQGNFIREFFPSGIQYLLSPRCSSLFIQQKSFVHNQKLYEKLNIPPRPRKPKTAFFRFLDQVRPTLLKEYPDLKVTELMKVAGQRWSNVDSKLKEKLNREFAEDYITYNKLKAQYEQNLTPSQRQLIEEALISNHELEEEKKIKKKSRELGKPKRPRSSFLKFLSSKQSEVSKYSNSKDWIKAVSEEWKSVGADVKAKLEEERKSEVEKYNKELELWEKRMIKEGNLDIVRKASLPSQHKTKLKL